VSKKKPIEDEDLPGEDVSRGRTYLRPVARMAVAASVGVGVLGGIVWTLLPASHSAPAVQSFNHNEGRPWAPPVMPAAFQVPVASAPPTPPAAKSPPELPAPVAPAVQPMGFYQNASVYQTVQQSTAQRASHQQMGSINSADPSATVANPQQSGVDPAQRRAGVARAMVGKPFNLHYLLKRNTIFHCIPEQPLDSDVPGPIGCTVAEDVMSADGSVVLIEKGSSVDGEVTRAPALGTNRMFIEFDEVLTLSGMPIYLSGTGGDTLGTSGVDGAVDEHLWRKIRAAVLLSLVQVGGQVAENQSQKNNNINLNVGGAGDSLASQAFAHDINIQPTLLRNQADPITVTVRQDIPMDDAYRLVAMDGPR
jgi:type IV secretion system protein VirB10